MSGHVLVSHPTGNANVTAVVGALFEADLLDAFFTCIAWRPESALARMVPTELRNTLARRARVQLPSELIHTRPGRELIRNAIIRAGKKRWIARETNPFSIDSVYADLDREVARKLSQFPRTKAVYAYEDGALHQFLRARQLAIHRIYDLPIGYWRANITISTEEAQLQPEWSGTLNALANSQAKCALKDRELELADTVVVPSTFVKETLDLYPGSSRKKIIVNPFGVPANIAGPRLVTRKDEALRVLYVGSLTQRKGISYLFQAVEKAGKAVSLTIIGRKVGSAALLDRYCSEHRWVSTLPHAQILEEMQQHDVFVFPSLFEGMALVTGEALSQGLPVITTPNSGGADILRHGVDGFLVPIRDANAITERLMQLYDDRELLKRMSDSARETAKQLGWKGYQDRTVRLILDVLRP